jgi:hypothetical protein
VTLPCDAPRCAGHTAERNSGPRGFSTTSQRVMGFLLSVDPVDVVQGGEMNPVLIRYKAVADNFCLKYNALHRNVSDTILNKLFGFNTRKFSISTSKY